MNPTQMIKAMIRQRNMDVGERKIFPWEPAARARFRAEHFVETLHAFGLKHAKTWAPDPLKELVRVYLGRDAYISVSREGPSMTNHGQDAVERGKITFSTRSLYPNQRDAFKQAWEAHHAWAKAMLTATDAYDAELIEIADSIDPDTEGYAIHQLDRMAV